MHFNVTYNVVVGLFRLQLAIYLHGDLKEKTSIFTVKTLYALNTPSLQSHLSRRRAPRGPISTSEPVTKLFCIRLA